MLYTRKYAIVPENAGLNTAQDGLGPIAPTYTTLFTSPKIVAHQFDFSELAMEMAAIDDGIGDIRAQMREDMGKHHAEVQNKMLVINIVFMLFHMVPLVFKESDWLRKNFYQSESCLKSYPGEQIGGYHVKKYKDCLRKGGNWKILN